MSFLTENLLSILLAIFVVLIILIIKKRLNYFFNRDIPSVDLSWNDIINTFSLSVFSDFPNQIYSRYKDTDKPYIGFYSTFLTPSILILDPSQVENVLIKDFSYFQDHGFDIDFKRNPLAGHLFNMKGDEWRTLRHKLVPTFTSGKLRGMVPIMEECADKLIEEIQSDPKLKTNTLLKDLYKKFSLSVIASCAFGIDPDSIKDPKCQFRQIMQDVVKPRLLTNLIFTLMFFFPKLLNTLNLKVAPQYIEDFMLSLTKQSLETRKKSGIKRNDFIQLLLELKEKGSVELDIKDLEQDEKDTIANIQKEPTQAKLELTDELLMAQVFVFLVGGFENTAFLVGMIQYLLSKHPDIQTRVREEVIQARDKYGSVDYQALKDMKLLGACIDEGLRIYSPGIVMLRESNKPYTFSDGKKIDKGLPVYIPAKALHMDSKYWSDPEKFDPERFLRGESIRPGTYLPFGDGPRICIAQRFALLLTKIMLAKLLLNFELIPSLKNKEPMELTVLLTADFKGGLWGTFKDLKT